MPLQIGFADSDHVSAQFVPDAPLEPATEYTFTVTQAIRNTAGQPLLEPLVLQFTTINSSPAPSGVQEFHVTGTVTDDANAPLSGADVYFSPDVPSGPENQQVRTTTDGDGKFAIDFSSVVGIPGSPATPSPVIAFAFANKSGYVWESRYVLANGVSDLHFTLYRPTSITAGDSVLVTVTPNDGVCDNNTQDMHPWPTEWRCRTIYVSPGAVDGTLHLAIGTTCQKVCLGLYAEPLDTVVNGVQVLPMLHGFPIMVQVEVPWLDEQNETVWLRTSFTPAP